MNTTVRISEKVSDQKGARGKKMATISPGLAPASPGDNPLPRREKTRNVILLMVSLLVCFIVIYSFPALRNDIILGFTRLIPLNSDDYALESRLPTNPL